MAQLLNSIIVGNGMIANSIKRNTGNIQNAVIFASGVSDSICSNLSEYNREIKLLNQTLEYCLSRSSKIVYFSSAGAIYGNCYEEKSEKSLLKPVTCYGRHKLLCEDLIKKSKVDFFILRLSNLIGPNQNKKQLIPYLVDKANFGQVNLFREATRDLLDVDDLAKLTYKILAESKSNNIINVVSGRAVPILKIFDEIQNILGTDAQINIVDGGYRHSFSNAKLRKTINVSFKIDYWQLSLRKYINRI